MRLPGGHVVPVGCAVGHQHAAIDVDGAAGDHGGGGGKQEGDGLGHVGRLDPTAQRHRVGHGGDALGAEAAVDHGRERGAWADRVDADALAGQLEGHVPRESEHRALGRGVGRVARIGHALARDGGHVDHRAAVAHQRCGLAQAQHGAAQVHVEHAVPVARVHVREQVARFDARAVDQPIDAAEAMCDGGEGGAHRVFLRQVSGDVREAAIGHCGRERGVGHGGAIERDHVVAALREQGGGGRADAAGAARDDGHRSGVVRVVGVRNKRHDNFLGSAI